MLYPYPIGTRGNTRINLRDNRKWHSALYLPNGHLEIDYSRASYPPHEGRSILNHPIRFSIGSQPWQGWIYLPRHHPLSTFFTHNINKCCNERWLNTQPSGLIPPLSSPSFRPLWLQTITTIMTKRKEPFNIVFHSLSNDLPLSLRWNQDGGRAISGMYSRSIGVTKITSLLHMTPWWMSNPPKIIFLCLNSK